MILLSVGTQLPFDRLVCTVDQWAQSQGRDDIVAQIGPSSYQPLMLKSFHFMDHEKFRDLQRQASLMISHAGMGSIITALELGIPIIILARNGRLGEHRNGHQMATLRRFRDFPGVYAAEDEKELATLLSQSDSLTSRPQLGSGASHELIQKLNEYIELPKPVGRIIRAWRRLQSSLSLSSYSRP